MKLRTNQRRALRIIAASDAHDDEAAPITVLNELIALGLARVTERYIDTWGGKDRQCRMVGITDAGRQALKDGRP